MDGQNYIELFKDPRWQKKRLEILERDEWACRLCCDEKTTLHIHHTWYDKNKKPWEYEDHQLITLCETCHEEEKIKSRRYLQDIQNIIRQHGYFSSDLQIISKALKDENVLTILYRIGMKNKKYLKNLMSI